MRTWLTLRQIAKGIQNNCNAVNDGSISWEEFSNRQRTLWDQAARGEVPVIGTPCSRRIAKVHKILRKPVIESRNPVVLALFQKSESLA